MTATEADYLKQVIIFMGLQKPVIKQIYFSTFDLFLFHHSLKGEYVLIILSHIAVPAFLFLFR